MSGRAFAKTYEEILTHARSLLERLTEEEEYRAVEARARAMGLSLTATYRHTHTPDFAARFIPDADAEGKLPAGYAMELWIDLNRGDHIVAYLDDDGNEIQCSYALTAAISVSYLLFSRVELLSYEDILAENPLFDVLTDDLDAIEDLGDLDSPFLRDHLTPVSPRGEVCLLTDKSQVGEGSYVEIRIGEYDGTFGHDDSLYFAEDAFLPYRMLLLALFGAERLTAGEYLTLTGEETQELIEALDSMPSALSGAITYPDALLDTYCLEAFTPPPRLETCLNRLTFSRSKEFLTDVAALSERLSGRPSPDTPITFIW